MNKTTSTATAILAFAVMFGGSAAVAAPMDQIAVPDQAFKTCLNQLLGQHDNAPIQERQAAEMTKDIWCTDAGITDLTGIDAFTSSIRIVLAGNAITDLEPLTGMDHVIALTLGRNPVSDIAPVSSLEALSSFSASEAGIEDLSPLSALPNLTTVIVSFNPISSLDPLASVNTLQSLTAEATGISDVNVVASLDNLETLQVPSNKITSVEPLAGKTKLKKVNLNANQILDISPIENMTFSHAAIDGQTATLPDIKETETQANPLLYAANAFVTPTSDTAIISPDGSSWTVAYQKKKVHRINWTTPPAISLRFITFSGQIAQLAVEVPLDFRITAQPSSVAVVEGAEVTLSAAATSNKGTNSVQWQERVDDGATWTDIAGATAEVLSYGTAVQAQSGTQFRAAFTNTTSGVVEELITDIATLTVVDAVPEFRITTQPVSVSVEEGADAEFTASASSSSGTNTVQWQQSADAGVTWTEIAGATAETLNQAAVVRAQSGTQFRAVFVNTEIGTAGKLTTDTVTLTVTSVPGEDVDPPVTRPTDEDDKSTPGGAGSNGSAAAKASNEAGLAITGAEEYVGGLVALALSIMAAGGSSLLIRRRQTK